MKSYSEKLQDPQWISFREYVIENREDRCRREERPLSCEDCSQTMERRQAHVHHRRYIKGREPWNYSLDDVQVLCSDCHEIIHEVENRARALIRSISPTIAEEFGWLLTELENCAESETYHLRIALAHAKNAARRVYHNEKSGGGWEAAVIRNRTIAKMLMELADEDEREGIRCSPKIFDEEVEF